jgi:site-specific recombinase XerD
MYSAFKQYLLTLKLSQISRKLYLADVRRFLIWLHQGQADLFDVLPDLDEVISKETYPRYLESLKAQQLAPAVLKRTAASLRQFGSFIAHTYSVPNPLSNFSLVFKPAPQTVNFAFQNYIKHFTNYLTIEQLSPLTIKSYKSDITRYLDYAAVHWPSTRITELLSDKNVQKYLNHLTNSDSALSSTIERKGKSISRFTAWLGQTYPKLAVSDNNEFASKASDKRLLQDNSPIIPAQSDEPLTHLISSSEVEINQPNFFASRVKNNNYRKLLSSIWTPTFRNFVSLAILLIFASTLAIFGYRQFARDVKLTAAYPSTPVTPNRQLSFQGRLENAAGTPITTATNLTFKLWNQLSGGTEGSCTGGGDNCLYSTGACSITPDSDGVFSTQIGSSCGSGIPSSVFTENSDIWLEVVVAAETLTPRQPIASVAYALNSETIQGFPISSTVSAIRNTVVPMNEWGEIIVGEQSPRLTGVAGTFQISAPSLSLVTATGTNGNITLAPDGTGQINFNGNTTTTNFFNVSNAQLTTGSLITGTVGNNNTGFNLIDLSSGASPTSKFSVTDAGLTTVGADLYVSSGISLFNNAVTDDTVEATKFCTGDGETNCVADFAAISGGASIWTDAGTYAYLTNGEVIGNSASAGSNKLAGLYLADSAPAVFGTDNDITLTFAGTELGITQGNNDVNFDSNTLFVDGSANRVGIGTNAPNTQLEISNTGGTANLRLTGSGANVVHQIADEYDINYTRTTGSATIDFRALSADTTSTGDYRFGLSSGSTGANRIFLYQPNSATIQTKLATSGESSYINAQGGSLGIGTVGPDAKLDSLSTTGQQLRLTYTDGTVYSGFTLDSSGNLTIDNTGTRTIVADDFQITGDDLFMTTNTSGFILVADGTNFNPVAVSGDITIDSTGATAIGSDKITEAMLKSVNAPTDELCLSYESTVGDFEWQTCGSAGSGSNWRYNLGAISHINDTVDLLVGSNATASAKFAVLNVNSGTPTASVSAGTTGATFVTADGYLSTTARQSLTLGNSSSFDTTGNILLHPNASGRVGIGTAAPDAQLEINNATGNNLRLTYNDVDGAATAYTDFLLASDGDLTIDSAGGAITIGAGDDLNLTAATDLIFGGTTSLGETTAAGDSGAFLVGVFDEFDNSNSLNVQAVLNDLDAALATALLGSSLWTDGGTFIYPTASEVLGNSASGGANKILGLYLADSAPLVFGTDNDFTFAFDNSTSTLGSTLTAGTRLGINTTSALATVDIRSSLGTIPVASISGNTSMAALVVDQSGSGDIFTASSSGETRFVVKSNGNVGVGVADPTSKLQIAGTSSIISNNSGDLTIDSFSGNLVLGTDDDLIPTLGAGDANIGAVGTPWDNIYATNISATVFTQNGNLVCDDSGANCPIVGPSYWDQALGTLQPYNKTVDLLLGGTATDSAKIALININNGTPTASVSAGTAGATYLTAAGVIATTAKQTLALGDATTTGNIILQGGNVGIGVAAPAEKLEVNGNVVSQRFIDSANSAYYLDAAASGTSLSVEGNLVSNGAFSITSNATNGNITIDAGSGTVLIGAAGAGKLDAGTIDPPYTINGEKFATYMAGMTGVKEETTGTVKAEEYVAGSGYRATLDFANALSGSDLWLFRKTSNLQNNLDKLVVLLSTSSNSKTWYEIEAGSGKLYLYSTSPTNISYRLTAPRFDANAWENTRDSESIGFVINDQDNWSVSDTLASAFASGKSQLDTLFGNLETNLISPLATDSAVIVEAPVIITPPQDATGPALYVNGEIESSSVSARFATLENIQADTITAKNIIADTIEANHIIGLDAKIATLSGISESDITSITDRIKARLASLSGNDPSAQDIPVTADPTEAEILIPEVNPDSLASDLASVSATIANLDADFVTINNYLAVIGQATITSLSVTDQLSVASIQSTSTTTLALQPQGGTINLASGTLIVDSLGEVAVNGNLTVSGKVLASAVETDYIAIGTPKDASSSSALGQLLAIYNESGEAVATIDASGSANLASVTTQLITIAAGKDSTPSGLLTATAQSNSTAGESILVSPNTELTIESPFATSNSLVYLTPTTNTDNKVLFIKTKTEGSFTVAIDAPASSDISFNWWIIQLDKPNEN